MINDVNQSDDCGGNGMTFPNESTNQSQKVTFLADLMGHCTKKTISFFANGNRVGEQWIVLQHLVDGIVGSKIVEISVKKVTLKTLPLLYRRADVQVQDNRKKFSKNIFGQKVRQIALLKCKQNFSILRDVLLCLYYPSGTCRGDTL